MADNSEEQAMFTSLPPSNLLSGGKRRSGWILMAFTLLAEIVGVGVLSLPFAVAQLGWLLGAA